jgi:hypothetical protein
LDRPESATWQRAALFDTRLSSSDSTPSQFDRKFVIRRKVVAFAVAAFFHALILALILEEQSATI